MAMKIAIKNQRYQNIKKAIAKEERSKRLGSLGCVFSGEIGSNFIAELRPYTSNKSLPGFDIYNCLLFQKKLTFFLYIYLSLPYQPVSNLCPIGRVAG